MHLGSINVANLHAAKSSLPAVGVGLAAAAFVGKRAYSKTEDSVISSLNGNGYEVLWQEDGKEIRRFKPAADAVATLSSALLGVAISGAGGMALARVKAMPFAGGRSALVSQGLAGVAGLMIGAGIGHVAGTVAASSLYAGAEMHFGGSSS